MKRKYYKKYELAPLEADVTKCPDKAMHHKNVGISFGPFQLEDILIIALIFVMLTEDEPDYPTVLALGFLLFS